MTRAKPNTTEGLLRSIVERVERVEEQVTDLNADKSEIYKEAKSHGFDMKALREVVRLRRKDPTERAEHDALVDLYMAHLGGSGPDGTEIVPHARTHEVSEVGQSSSRRALTDETEAGASTSPENVADEISGNHHAATPRPHGGDHDVADEPNHSRMIIGTAADSHPVAASPVDEFPEMPSFLVRRA